MPGPNGRTRHSIGLRAATRRITHALFRHEAGASVCRLRDETPNTHKDGNAMDQRRSPKPFRHCLSGSIALAIAFGAGPVIAEPADDSPLLGGWYAAPMASYIRPDSNRVLDDGLGGTLAVGYRVNPAFAIELYGVYGSADREAAPDGSARMVGGGIGALAFLDELLPGAYLPFAVGHLEVEDNGADVEPYDGLMFEAGIGYLLPLSFGRYDFAIRTEGRFRHHNGQDGRRLDEDASGAQDLIVHLGLQLPFGLVPEPPPPEPVRVVEATPPPDGDADGVPDDADQCPDSATGATVDATGCAPPPPPLPVCGPQASGGIALTGCAAGDAVVLRGVRFASDRAVLAAGAERILDEVATALAAHPVIRVEIGGHTDSRGADTYNARLSARRAEAVRDYLTDSGIAADRLVTRGYGEARPIADNETGEGRSLNRRVELTILSAAPS